MTTFDRSNWLLCASLLACIGCAENVTPWAAPGDDPLALCMPNLDGRIDVAELSGQVGLRGRYERSLGPIAVDVDGTIGADGRRVWDWREATGEPLEIVVEGTGWWRDEVPEATMAVPAGGEGTELLLLSSDERGLWLHGYASAAENPPKQHILLRYATPVPSLRFPLQVGDTWSADVAKTGVYLGQPFNGSDRWQVSVDAAGEMRLPDLSAGPALRVRTTVEARSALGASSVVHQTVFYFECLGELGRAVSSALPAGTAPDWSAAAERRILVP